MTKHHDAAEKYWKSILAFSGVAGIALIGGMMWSQDHPETSTASFVEAVPIEQAPAPVEAEPTIQDQELPSVAETQPAPAKAVLEGPFAVDAGYHFLNGFFETDSGICTSLLAHNNREMANEIEAVVGRRVEAYSGFDQGMIVQFKDGSRKVIWALEIDCKDPPYNPLAEPR